MIVQVSSVVVPQSVVRETLIKCEFQLGRRTGVDARAYIANLIRGSLGVGTAISSGVPSTGIAEPINYPPFFPLTALRGGRASFSCTRAEARILCLPPNKENPK